MSFDPLESVRTEVRALKAYHLDLSKSRHKLDQNEVPFELPLPIKRRVAEELLRRPWARYPDFHSESLRRALGRYHDWPSDGVLVGNGSGELLSVALSTFVQPGGVVLLTRPSFSLYGALLARAGAVGHWIASEENLRLPLRRLQQLSGESPQWPVLLCSPNNPTGDTASVEAIDELLQTLQAPLLLDNAYGEFCDQDYRPLLKRHRHLILFRTFSKAWAMAGLRLGYLLADPALVAELAKVKSPYNVNFLTATAAEVLVREEAASRRRIEVLKGRRVQWAEMLDDVGFTVYPSQANFVLVRHTEAPEIGRALGARGIRVRVLGGHPVLAECLRFSVGTGIALRETRRAILEIFAEMKEKGR